MRRLRIVAVAVVAVALAAWWVPPEVSGGGNGCPGGGACAEGPPAQGTSGGPAWFYGGEGVDRIPGRGGGQPYVQEEAGDGGGNRCGPGGYEAPTGAGEEHPRGCEDVQARLY